MLPNLISTLKYVNRLRQAKTAWRNQKIVLDNMPFEYVLEPTNHCNLRCKKCVHGTGMKRKKGYMKLQDFRAILEKIRFFAESIFFTGGGEPTLHPDLFQMIKEAKQKDIRRTWLLTNGTSLIPEDFPKIIDSKLDNLEITLDGTDKKTHEQISIGSNFEKIIENITSFLKYKKSIKANRPFTSIKIIKHSNTQSATVCKKFLAKFKHTPADRIYIKSLTYHSEYSRVFLENDKFTGLNRDRILNRKWDKYFPCLSVYMQVMIGWNGDVIACCGDLEGINIAGNLLNKQTSVPVIWNDQTFQNLRKKLINKQLIPPCTICSQLWQGRPKNKQLDELLLIPRISMQMVRDFYPSLAKKYYSIGFLNRLTGER